ncbi:SLOG family protein [Capilliphycus salinus ALCB114379]|uniref:SLOG family protein n=1 Tax=Capilliphycus salinus TaxID=2768948 RepID=UPI0039A4E3F4
MKVAFITGHRIINYPVVRQGIEQLTNLAIERETTTFLSGMAIGTDQLAAEVWSSRYLPWKAILPCQDQSALWTTNQQLHYRKLLTKASEIQILYPKYQRGVMQARNQFLVKNSQLGLAVWDGTETGGAFLTIQMARNVSKPLIIFNPPFTATIYSTTHLS